MAGLFLASASNVQAALPASMGSQQTITQQAYGVGSGADRSGAGGSKVAGLGCLSSATLGTLVLCWLWYTLPR